MKVTSERKCMICGYGRYCNNCVVNGDSHKAMFPKRERFDAEIFKVAIIMASIAAGVFTALYLFLVWYGHMPIGAMSW